MKLQSRNVDKNERRGPIFCRIKYEANPMRSLELYSGSLYIHTYIHTCTHTPSMLDLSMRVVLFPVACRVKPKWWAAIHCSVLIKGTPSPIHADSRALHYSYFNTHFERKTKFNCGLVISHTLYSHYTLHSSRKSHHHFPM